MGFKQKTFEFVLQAMQPIAHCAGTEGNHSYLMTQGQVQPDGTIVDVPIITGDCLRHGMREAIAMAFLDAAGLIDEPTLNKAALRLLFNGGMVTGRGGDASNIKLDLYREMVAVIPGLGLLGGCANNRVIQGYVWADNAILICDETQHLIPQRVLDWIDERGTHINESAAHVEVAQRVRMDATLDPSKVRLLNPGEQAELQNRLLMSEVAHDNDDDVGRQETKSAMLPRTNEQIKPGSLFYWSVTANLYSPLEEDTFVTMVASFLYNARVGGKKATGHGLIKPIRAWDVQLSPISERTEVLKGDELGLRVGEMFRNHVKANAARVREFLSTVEA